MRERIQARDLRPGDLLRGSGETVEAIHPYIAGKPRKIHLRLSKDGKERTAEWGRYTEVWIET